MHQSDNHFGKYGYVEFHFLIELFHIMNTVLLQKVKCSYLDSAPTFFVPYWENLLSLFVLGRLSGVMDDRGKYIYISQEEMQAVADYIKRQGRVSISHLASKSNQFIDLEPKAQFVEEVSSVEEIAATWSS